MTAPPLSLRGVYDSLRMPTLQDLIFTAKAFLATILALLAGFSQNLENPYWAVLTIYIVLAPPETGAIRSKALFRFFGTIVGGTLMMAVTGLFGDQLGILATVTIAIIVGATFLRQIDRTPVSYLWFSGGVTAGVVGLSNLMQPTNVFDFATARMGEISLGIIAITAVDSLFWPRPMTPEFLQTMASWRRQARSWAIDALGLAVAQAPEEERRQAVRQRLHDLTKAVGVIDAKTVQLPFDVIAVAPRGRHLDLVRRQVIEMIADLQQLETWTRALRREHALHTDLARMLDAVTEWVQQGSDLPDLTTCGHVMRGEALVDQLDAAARRGFDPVTGQTACVEQGLSLRLAAFVRDWSDLSLALRAIETGGRLPVHLRGRARNSRPVRSIDYLGAAFDVAPMVLSMTFSILLWYFTAWSSGGGALLFSFVGCVFLIGQAQILRSSVGLIAWILTAFGLVFLYQFAVLPRVTDFPVLIAVLGCAMLPFGLLMTMSTAGMLICAYMFAFLGLQNAYAADFNQSLQTLSSSLVGLLIAVASLYVCSYDRAAFATRRLVAAMRRDIFDIAISHRKPDRNRFLFLAVDRLALFLPAAERIGVGGSIPRPTMFDDFGFGLNLLALRQWADDGSPVVRDAIARVRESAADAYRDTRVDRPKDGSLRATIEAALADPAVGGVAEGRLLDALTGMRLCLKDVANPPISDLTRS